MPAYHSDYQAERIPMHVVPLEPLRGLVREVLRRSPMPPADADIVADALVMSELTNLQGQGQGVRRARSYRQRALDGKFDPQAPFDVLKESPALALVDAHNGSGTVISVRAMRLAAQKAQQNGIGAVMVRHSTHFGSAAFSARQALPYGCIGVSLTNAGPEMAPWGGLDPVLGTNPWAVVIPTGESPDDMPIVLDMAITMAGKGMMRWLLRDGRRMPRTWAITRDGRETDDPAEAMDGTLLPMGDYKGYGLSLITDVLTGVLGGSAYGIMPYRDQSRLDVGHQFIAYHIDWFMDRHEFFARMRDFISMVRASRVRPGHKEILLPGELEWRRMQEKMRHGVPLDEDTYHELRQLAGELAVPWPFD